MRSLFVSFAPSNWRSDRTFYMLQRPSEPTPEFRVYVTVLGCVEHWHSPCKFWNVWRSRRCCN
jgi:hypothetical protein